MTVVQSELCIAQCSTRLLTRNGRIARASRPRRQIPYAAFDCSLICRPAWAADHVRSRGRFDRRQCE